MHCFRFPPWLPVSAVPPCHLIALPRVMLCSISAKHQAVKPFFTKNTCTKRIKRKRLKPQRLQAFPFIFDRTGFKNRLWSNGASGEVSVCLYIPLGYNHPYKLFAHFLRSIQKPLHGGSSAWAPAPYPPAGRYSARPRAPHSGIWSLPGFSANRSSCPDLFVVHKRAKK